MTARGLDAGLHLTPSEEEATWTPRKSGLRVGEGEGGAARPRGQGAGRVQAGDAPQVLSEPPVMACRGAQRRGKLLGEAGAATGRLMSLWTKGAGWPSALKTNL